MLETIKNEFQNLESSITTDNMPRLDNQAPLALFYKKEIDGKILYTNVQEGKIHYFISENVDILHQNNSFELMYVLSGTAINKIEDKEYYYQAGQGCLFNRRIAHSEIIENGQVLFLNFSQKFLEDLLNPLKESKATQGQIFQFLLDDLDGKEDWKRSYIEFSPTTLSDDNIFHHLLDAIQLELATSKIGAEYFQKGLVLRILTELENPNSFQAKPVNIDLSKEEYLVNRLISLIETHYGDITRKKIEKLLHYNSEYLNRLLKKHSNMTIINYAKAVRIKRAKQLLCKTNLTVAEIADSLGFSSENYFYHYFKNETQLSPKQYRTKKVQEN